MVYIMAQITLNLAYILHTQALRGLQSPGSNPAPFPLLVHVVPAGLDVAVGTTRQLSCSKSGDVW